MSEKKEPRFGGRWRLTARLRDVSRSADCFEIYVLLNWDIYHICGVNILVSFSVLAVIPISIGSTVHKCQALSLIFKSHALTKTFTCEISPSAIQLQYYIC